MLDENTLSQTRRAPGEGRAALPPILAGARRALVARLIANGALQAGIAIALAFAVFASAGAFEPRTLALVGALAAALVLLRVVELNDAERLGLDYVMQVRLMLFDALIDGRKPMGHGVAMTRLMNDLSALKNWVGLGLARSLSSGLALAGLLVSAALLSLEHFLVILAPSVGVAMVAAALARPLFRRVGAVRSKRGRLANLLGEALLARRTLRAFGEARRSRRRVRTASEELSLALQRRVRVAAVLRGLPELYLPLAVITAVALDGPVASGAVALLLLAGLATGPLRQMLRAIEYRAAFVVAQERLSAGLNAEPDRSKRRAKPKPQRLALASERTPGLSLASGPPDEVWRRLGEVGAPVTADADVLPRSLRRNIDLTRQHRGDDAALEAIAAACGLLDDAFAPRGLETRLNEESAELTEARRARLSLARAVAAGAKRIVVNAPVLLMDSSGRALLRDAPGRFGVHVTVLTGDQAFDAEPPGARERPARTPSDAT